MCLKDMLLLVNQRQKHGSELVCECGEITNGQKEEWSHAVTKLWTTGQCTKVLQMRKAQPTGASNMTRVCAFVYKTLFFWTSMTVTCYTQLPHLPQLPRSLK